MKKTLYKLFGLALVAVLLFCMIPKILPAARGQPPAPSFWVEPATEAFTTDNANVGTLFNVTVWGSVATNTTAWIVELGFDASELQAVAVNFNSDFFAGYSLVELPPEIDNESGTILIGEIIIGSGYVGPMSGSLFSVMFEVTAAPAQGQSLTSLIDPGYGVASGYTAFYDADYNVETPLSTAPCAYTFRDSAAWSPDPTFVSCSPNLVTPNSPVNCTAVVSGINATGTITWSSNSSTGSFSPSVCTLSSAACSTTYTDSSYGTVTITATYSGDTNNMPTNGTTILNIPNPIEQSSTYFSFSPNPAHINGPVSCIATVYGNNPTGTVTWSCNSSTGSFSPSVCTLSSEYKSPYGTCSTTYTDTNTGTVTITASYSGDPNNTPSNDSAFLEESSQAIPSSTYVYFSGNTFHVNQPVYFTASVFGFDPTGTVTWSSNSSTGSFSPSVCTLSSESSYGTCATTYTDTSAGTVTITANYSGDTNNIQSNGSATLEESAQAVSSSIYFSCSPNPAHVNEPVNCFAVVYGLAPTGTVTWSSNSSTGSFSPSVCTLSSEISESSYVYCSTTYTDTNTGTVTITASYSGDPNNTPSNCSAFLEESSQAVSSSTYVYCSPNPAHVNEPVYFTASVYGLDPTGTVTWSSNSSTGSFSPSVCTLSYGSCSTTYTDSSYGTVTITATYSGDTNNAPSNGTTILEESSQVESSTSIYCSSSSTYANSPVTCTAIVYGFDPTGTVTWSSNSSTGSFSPSVCTLSYGSCSTTYTDTNAGTVTITASYGGDPDNTPSGGSTTLTLIPEPVLPSAVLLNVPYHAQINDYDCGPAALEEVFNYYGPDVPQYQIMDVARTTSSEGTYDIDLIRAAQFSNLSSTTESQAEELHPFSGYPSRSLGYAALDCYGMSIEELKAVLAAGYPVIVLTTWHFRVAVGYTSQYIIFQDPYYGSMYEMTYAAFSADWDYSDHWGLLVCPWQVEISNPHNVLPGDTFTVNATITYPEVYPFQYNSINTPEATSVNATLTLPSGLALAPSETAQKACESTFGPGQSFTVSWQVQCQSVGDYSIGIEAEGLVGGFMIAEPPTYPQSYTYEDRIGGTNQSILACTPTLDTTPPVTTENYDGSWQNHAFTINLTASDDLSGVYDTYYSINGGPTEAVSTDGQPTITTPGANNTLEYWSIDWAGNVEAPHYLTGIKLDETPPSVSDLVFTPASNVQPHQSVDVWVNATDALSGVQNVTLQYSLDNGVSWVNQPMTLNASTLLFEASIPGQHAGATVNFDVTACDQAGNTATLLNYSSSFNYEVTPLSANMSCTLDCLDLGFNGQWLTFQLVQPEGYSLESVNISSVTLCNAVTANPNLTNVTVNNNGVSELLVSFNRTAVSEFIMGFLTTGNVTLSFSGALDDGSLFVGTLTLCVHMPGDVNMDGKVDIRDLNMIAKAYGSRVGQPGYKSVLDENEDGLIDIRDVAIVAKNYGKTYGPPVNVTVT